jgi:2-dehydro-3-deoxyphosphogluconate aldolase/(4S)-4-hydroxy-2-oxoglutarate aldolase
MRDQVITAVKEHKIIAILRGQSVEDTLTFAKGLYAGGVRCFEVPLGHQDSLQAIAALRERLNDAYIGAGTVMTPDQVDEVRQAGATYVISPVMSQPVIHRTREQGLVSMPGCFSPTDCWQADQAGADFIKLFPAARLGASYIKDLHGPMPHLQLIAVGGIGLNHISEYAQAGAVAFGIGSAFTDRDLLQDEDSLQKVAQQYVTIAQGGQWV